MVGFCRMRPQAKARKRERTFASRRELHAYPALISFLVAVLLPVVVGLISLRYG